MAVLLITHDLGVGAETCDDVAVMYAGRIVEQAPVAALFAAPAHPYTVGLMRAVPRAESTNPPPSRADDRSPPGARERLLEIAGTVPPLSAPPPGCAFADRCPRVQDDCRAAMPALTADDHGDPDHLFRCIHPHRHDHGNERLV
jgi:oligopeptide/dipeptide ABC transporter ATP-binding protein